MWMPDRSGRLLPYGSENVTEAEMIYLVKKALQMMRDAGQDDGNIVIEVRRKEPRHVRFDIEVRPSYDDRTNR